MIFCLFHRFPQGCSLRGHWERRSNSKSVGVPLIWTLEDWTTTPITQALLWIPPPLLLPPHLSLFIPPLSFHSTSPPPLTCTSSSPPAALTTMVIYPSLSLVQLTIVLLCKLFLDVDRAIKCYTKKYSCMVIQNCIL